MFKRTSEHLYHYQKHTKCLILFNCLKYQYLANHGHDLKNIAVKPFDVAPKQRGQSHTQFEVNVKSVSWAGYTGYFGK